MNRLLLIYPLFPMLISSHIDRRSGRIPNAVTFPAILLGLALCYCLCSFTYFLQCCAAILLLFLAGAIGIAGMGDIKLLMSVASVSGFLPTVITLGLSAILLVLHSACVNWRGTMAELKTVVWAIGIGDLRLINRQGEKRPFAPYLAAGYTIIAFWRWLS